MTVKRITLWRTEVANRPGVLSQTLDPLAASGADLQVVMGYRYPGSETKAAIEVYPISGKKHSSAAATVGLAASAIPALLVEGNNKPGLGQAIAGAMADAGLNLGFLIAQVVGKKFSAVVGFANEADAKTATPLIKKATARKAMVKKAAAKKRK